MTLMECVQQAAERLSLAGVSFGHGTTNAFDEAAWLVQWRLGLPLAALDAQAHRPVTSTEQQAVLELVDERIRTRKPAAYLTGEAWLHGVPFFVDASVIIPRSLVAEPLVDGRLDVWINEPNARVLDLCTGNGSLAVLAALAWPELTVDASDISTKALAVAARNVSRHDLTARVTLHEGDGLHAVRGKRYDLILCNPPYVNESSMQALPLEFLAEPRLALAGGVDGMQFITRLLREAPSSMTDDAVMVLEIGHELNHFEHAFPWLEAMWLETSAGDFSVAVLTREALAAHP